MRCDGKKLYKLLIYEGLKKQKRDKEKKSGEKVTRKIIREKR